MRNRNATGFSVRTWRARIRRRTRIAFAWPSNAERKKPGLWSVSYRPTSAVTGIGPTVGGCATWPNTCMPLHSPSRRSDQGGTSCRQTASGSPEVTRRTISSTYRLPVGGQVLPWKMFQVRITTRLD